jgi:pyruvate/2-oxoglutarate dehydrogenase complex dihydrolipoamide dehydrogenase (E3) component
MDMGNTDFDWVVIGGGSAGYAAARTGHSLGLRVAVIDGAAELGGLCILRGCMPSKTLIESANRALTIRRAGEFGLQATGGPPDIRAIRDRKRALIADFAGYRQGQLEDGRFTLHRGSARFLDSHRLQITPRDGGGPFEITARFFCIATGSVANVPPVPGLKETGFWTSDDVLDADALPRSIAILGGGAIALEMAHYLEAMGVEITLIQRGKQMLKGMDPRCSDAVCAAYRHRGMKIHLGTKLEHVSTDGALKRLDFQHGDEKCSIAVEQILVATGRVPNLDGLGLDAASVRVTDGKIETTATMQTSQPHIFAAGDVCSPLDVVHVAIQQGEIAARNAAALLSSKDAAQEWDDRLLLFGVFSHPQVAGVGASEEELTQRGIPFENADYPFNDHGKSLVMGETEGFVKMICHRETGEILGATCVGPEATELIHEVVIAMHHRTTVADFAAIPHYHPTLSEIWTYPAEELADKVASNA